MNTITESFRITGRDDIVAFFSILRSLRSDAVSVVSQHYRDERTVIPFRKLVEIMKGHKAYNQLSSNIVKAVIQDVLAPFASYINPNTRRLKREHAGQDISWLLEECRDSLRARFTPKQLILSESFDVKETDKHIWNTSKNIKREFKGGAACIHFPSGSRLAPVEVTIARTNLVQLEEVVIGTLGDDHVLTLISTNVVILTEQVCLEPTKELFNICFLSKNLWNAANYIVRQEYFGSDRLIATRSEVFDLMKGTPEYKALPAQTANQILFRLCGDWQSFKTKQQQYKESLKHGTGKEPMHRPGLPGYKESEHGQCMVMFTNQQVSVRDGSDRENSNVVWRHTDEEPRPSTRNTFYVHFPDDVHLPPVETRLNRIDGVRIIPKPKWYVLEMIYKREINDLSLDTRRVLGIDLGAVHLVAAANNVGSRPFLIDAKRVKSANQSFAKEMARLRRERDEHNRYKIIRKNVMDIVLKGDFDEATGLVKQSSMDAAQIDLEASLAKHGAYRQELLVLRDGFTKTIEITELLRTMNEFFTKIFASDKEWLLNVMITRSNRIECRNSCSLC
jgi:hypothetical protein